jgi:phosphotriesterase-related protein
MAYPDTGKVVTARGPVEPAALGRVMMHEHLHSDIYDWDRGVLISEEKPATAERREYLLRHAVPLLRACRDHGMQAYVDTTMPPWRAWPDLYAEVSQAADVHIVLCTGFYREVEQGTYWVKKPEDRIWPRVLNASMEDLAEYCVEEIAEGIHGTGVRAGAIKLASSQAPLTELETKCFKAGARAQAKTGVHITTHCTRVGAESSQLTLLSEEGVDLNRVVVGHTAAHLMNQPSRATCIEWMKRGAHFLPTNLGIRAADPEGEAWRPLVDAIHAVFDAGCGDKLLLGLDSGYCSESKAFGPMTFLPPEPFLHMFTHTLPVFRALGLTPQEEDAMMLGNPQRVLPVRS